MKLYLDDDSITLALVNLLRQAKYDVLVPKEVGTQGSDDAVHFLLAIRTGRVLLSHNHDDFQNLHKLVTGAGGRHPGILMIRRDNDTRRDMKPAQVVRAIANVVASRDSVANEFIILNQWR